MTNKLEAAKMLKEDADLADCVIRRAELLADHYRIMSEETEGFESARYKQEMYNCVAQLTEAKHPDTDPEVIEHKSFEDYVISTHAITEGCVEGDEIKFVPVMENLADLSIELVESEIGQMHRVQMNGILNEDKADFHLFQSSAAGEFTIRMLGEGKSELVESFVEMASMPICEDTDKFDTWKQEVEQKNTEHAGKIKYVGKAENGANHVSAEIPTDKGPRSLGFYDMQSNEGHHLSEDAQETDVLETAKGKVYRVDSRPDKLWYESEELWNDHIKKINDTAYSGKLDVDRSTPTTKMTDPETTQTVGLFNPTVRHGWIISDHEGVVKEELTIFAKTLDEDYELSPKNMRKRSSVVEPTDAAPATASEAVQEEDPDEIEKKNRWDNALKAVDELGAAMKKSGSPTGSNYPAWNEKQKKFGVTYDIHGSNQDVPLYTRSVNVHADDENEAISTMKNLVGGRNHTAKLIESTGVEVALDMLSEGFDKEFKEKVSELIRQKTDDKFAGIVVDVAKAM